MRLRGMTREGLRGPALLGTLALLWLAARGAVPGAAAPPALDFQRIDLDVGGRITEVGYEDLNGDGKADILLVRGREIQVFFQQPDGFLQQPHQKWNFARDAVIFDTIDLEGTGKRSILYLAADGVYTYDLVGERFRLLRKRRKALETLTRRPSDDEIRRKDLCRDLNGDGREDLVIPEAEGLALYRNTDGAFGERKLLYAPPAAMVDPGQDQLSSRTQAIYWFSNPSIEDFNKDGRVDMLLPDGDRLKVYPQGEDGEFPQSPAEQIEVPFMKLLEAGQRPDFELDLTTPVMLQDLNGDGYVDMTSTHIGQGLTRIFMGSDKGLEGFKTPTQTLRAKGVAFFAFMVDLDGDGLDDLVVPRTDKIGIWYILKVLVTRSVPIDVLCYYQRPDPAQPYPTEPDFTREVEIPLVFQSNGSQMQVGTSFVASVSGDFNNDGRKDVIYRTDDTELGIFFGPKGRDGFPDDPSATVTIADATDVRAMLCDVPELNGDGASDIVLKYYSWDRDKDRISIFLSRGGK